MKNLVKKTENLYEEEARDDFDESFDMPSSPEDLHVPLPKELLVKGIRYDSKEFLDKQKNRILFVVPPGSVEENYGTMAAAATELPWLGMAYVAAAAREAGNIVKVAEFEIQRGTWGDVADSIKEFQPDIIAMALFINNVDRCLKVAKVAKEIDSNIKIVMGGPQATIFPDQTISNKNVDFIVISEAEISFCALSANLNTDEIKNVKGIWYKDDEGKIIKNERQPLIQDLDSLPAPALDLYPMKKYYPAVHVWGNKVANYVTSRGCPYECTFCEAKMTFGRTFRFHSPERIIEDLNNLNEKYGYDSFQFYDDIFTTNRKRTIQLCNAFIANKQKYKWMVWTRTDRLDPELCQIMKKAGCYLIVFGCESGDQHLLDFIKKGLTVEQNYKGIKIAHDAGLLTMSSFMLGLPESNEQRDMATIKFAMKSKLDYAIFPIFEPYPGTEIWKDSLERGYFVNSGKYTNYLLTNTSKIWVPNGTTRSNLENLSRLAFKKFFLRPKTVRVWLINLFNMPYKRILRFFWAGFFYLFIARNLEKVKKYRGRGSRY